MKKILCMLLSLAILLPLAACGEEPALSFEVPGIGETLEVTRTNRVSMPTDEDAILSAEQEAELHRQMGMKILSGEELSHSSPYKNRGFEGEFAYLVDSLYRTKLDLEVLLKKGYDDGTYREYLSLVEAFLADHKPEYLLPRGEDYEKIKETTFNWSQAFYNAAKLDEARLAADEKLMAIFSMQTFRAETRGSVTYDLTMYPLIQEKVRPTAPIPGEIRFDSDTCRTLIEVDFDPEDELLVYLTGEQIKGWAFPDLQIGSDPGVISLPCNFSGTISLATRNPLGVISTTRYLTVSSNLDRLPDTPVQLSSRRLEAAVRSALSLEEGVVLTRRILAGITNIFINGDFYAANPTNLTVDDYNRTIPATLNDFAFSDLDYFPCLTWLEIKNHQTGNPSGKGILHVKTVFLQHGQVQNGGNLSNQGVLHLKTGCPQNRFHKGKVGKLHTANVDFRNRSGNPKRRQKLLSYGKMLQALCGSQNRSVSHLVLE